VKHPVDLIIGDTWPKRRRVINATLLFCAALIETGMIAAVVKGDMTTVSGIVGSAFLLAGSTITSYVFGSYLDDKDKRANIPGQEHPKE
jgi:hypothetical protein